MPPRTPHPPAPRPPTPPHHPPHPPAPPHHPQPPPAPPHTPPPHTPPPPHHPQPPPAPHPQPHPPTKPHPPTQPHPPSSNDAPTGWTNKEADMYKHYYWAGNPGDIKDMLNKDYGLRDAQPIWTHLPTYGNILFIFQATPSTGKASHYVWNGIEGSVCHIESLTIEEIRQAINKLGKGKGYLEGLKLVPVTPT